MNRKLSITVASDEFSWINAYLPQLIKTLRTNGHRVYWVHQTKHVRNGDVAMYLSFGAIVKAPILARNRSNVVVHESDLPKGRGWSPVTWQVLNGIRQIPIALFEAVPRVDAGPVYFQDSFRLRGNELIDQIRNLQASKTIALCLKFISAFPRILMFGRMQRGRPSYFGRRRPEDSRLDPRKSLAKQFDLLRTVDNERYPAFFSLRGSTYRLKIEKVADASTRS